MQDGFGRTIDYLRISVTDLCNYRCRYCMPPEGVAKRGHGDILRLEEIEEIARAAVSLGVRKLRLTGGEPLARRGIVELCARLAAIPGVEDLAITTNGSLLPQMAGELKAAGVRRVNISLDTLREKKFQQLTRQGNLTDTLRGVEEALRQDLAPVKINTVLIGGCNDDEIGNLAALTCLWPVEVRFIELMPIGPAAQFGPEAFLPADTVLQRLPQLQEEPPDGGVARLYRLPGAPGRVGLITPLSCRFCAGCSRLRLTADGKLKPCLHSAEEIEVRGLHGEDLRQALLRAAACKPADYGALSRTERSRAHRDMNQIGG